MGTQNTFLMDVTVPADAVKPLAKVLWRAIGEADWWMGEDAAQASDVDLVAWTLFSAEGGSMDYAQGPSAHFTSDIEAAREDGSVVIQSGGYGKVSYESELFEQLYAAHGATGSVECELDDGMSGRYVVVLRNGLTETYEAQTIYPETEAQAVAVRLFAEFLQGGGDTSADLLEALADVVVERVR